MAELFIELFSEEIPARMQAKAAEDLAALTTRHLGKLLTAAPRIWYGPRRIAIAAEVAAVVPGTKIEARGPRIGAAEQAIAGFLRKHDATRDDLREDNGHWLLERETGPVPAADVIATALPAILRRFPWPKSMRWGGRSHFTWVRPLRRITCLLDGRVVAFDLREGEDDAHGLRSDNLTEGHRFHAPGAFAVESAADWADRLRHASVLVDAEERKQVIREGLARLASAKGLQVVDDPGLLDEVAGLVEWPVPLLGRIDDRFMDLPPEVMQVSMRVNQRYFALRTADGAAAPWFAFVANIEASDGGHAIIAGNERVLRARFADARHFWDLDRRTKLSDRVAALDKITFHAKLGTQGERVQRIAALAAIIAPLVGADRDRAVRAAHLAKADLVTGMVGEFPELQGVMGAYYAAHDGENATVAAAVREHYLPKGMSDAAPAAAVSVTVALADRLDQLAGFFAVGEKPTGSGDPYALRRAALGLIRIIRDSRLRLKLLDILPRALERYGGSIANTGDSISSDIFLFIIERLRVQLRAEGARHDVLDAVFAVGSDDDIVRLLARTSAVAALLGTEDGANLLTAYRRAANILRIEEKKDGPFPPEPNTALLSLAEEDALFGALRHASPTIAAQLDAEDFTAAMSTMAKLRLPLDAFFDRVTVNAPEPELRRNRLSLLAQVRATLDQVADFSKIES